LAKRVDGFSATDPSATMNKPMAAYSYSNREHLIVTDHTDRAELVS
jgi:acetoacetate decarboxylase